MKAMSDRAALAPLRLSVLLLTALMLLAGCGRNDGETGSEGAGEEEADGPPALARLPPVNDDTPHIRTLEELKALGSLRVATRNAPTTWYIDRHDQPVGPEYDLVAAFAEELGLTLELVIRDTPAGVLGAVASGEADLAAAGLTETSSREARFAQSPTYGTIKEQLVCHRDRRNIDEVDELAGVEIIVAAGSSYVETLEQLAPSLPELAFTAVPRSTEELLAAVAEKEVECTVADSQVAALNRRYYPALSRELDLTRGDPLVWLYRRVDLGLGEALEAWFEREDTRALVTRVHERYFGFVRMFDFVELRAYQRRLADRFPKYAPLFAAAAEKYDLPASVLAAQAYQESHWDPKATSPTGVRGIMMLTRSTAEAMGVEDRLDPVQSIEGGARYLARMRERFSDDIPDPDRTYLALAAYTVGRGHMHDAQRLARERGRDPYRWLDVKAVLPLLSDKTVYPDLKYGYARGGDAVRYVERIRNYEDILRQSVGEAWAAAATAGAG